ncbi:MAG TPA: hypothetical protein DD435_11655 [Cyanobacteria bacterium UBA8530]|nr:hypothetical protein [Cyanobacteria bacterium UBA8530]
MVQAFMPPTERLAEGTIKGLQFFIEMLDGREQFSKVYAGKKDIPTHHLAIIVADKKHQMATEAKVQLKITNTEGKSEKMDIAYNTGSKHIGHDFSFNKLGKYSFEGTLTFKGEKKPFKFQYTVK